MSSAPRTDHDHHGQTGSERFPMLGAQLLAGEYDDDGAEVSVHRYIEVSLDEKRLTPGAARALARTLLEAANELDGHTSWPVEG